MKLYADLPGRRARQIAADGLMLTWALLWIWAARTAHDAALTLAEPGRTLESAGGSFRDRMLGVGDRVDDLPLLADRLAGPFRDVSLVGTDIASAGSGLVTAAERLALVAALAVAVLPISLVGVLWLALRMRWVRRATALTRFLQRGGEPDLIALRALTHRPLASLETVDEPAEGWRRGDRRAIAALAALELRETGLRPPAGLSA
jgi:hypothetical protein